MHSLSHGLLSRRAHQMPASAQLSGASKRERFQLHLLSGFLLKQHNINSACWGQAPFSS